MKTLNIKLLITGIALLVSGFLLIDHYGLIDGADETAIEHAQLHVDANYVCPMHSQITDVEASACPICGMDLELRDAPDVSEDSAAVFISPAMQNNLAVRLQHVDTGVVAEEVYASGFVEKVSDAQEISISSKVSGKLVDVVVQQGQWVEEGDALVGPGG